MFYNILDSSNTGASNTKASDSGSANKANGKTQFVSGQPHGSHETESKDKSSGGLGFFAWYFILLLVTLLIVAGILALLYFLFKDQAMLLAKGCKYLFN